MEQSMTVAEKLGRKAATALRAYAAEREGALDAARRGFLDAALSRKSPRTATWVAVGMAACAVLIAASLAFNSPHTLEFTADGVAGSVDTWVAAPSTRPAELRFSDGSSLRVEPTSRARVVALDRNGASVVLETGTLHAEVIHRSNSAWRMIAGPFTVHVTGTRFDVTWSAVTDEFSITVTQGSVAVSGSAPGSQHAVVAGETLRVFGAGDRWILTRNDRHVAESHSAALEEIPPPEGAASVEPLVARSQPLTIRPAAEPDWRALCQRGSVTEAYVAASQAGFPAVCASASASELMALADGARLSGNAEPAAAALLELRRRFPNDARRGAAAFLLGKISFDQTHDYAAAARWFSTSLREQPSGSLAREASGRLIEAATRSGDPVGAHRAAQDYLLRYPDGPHATLARSLLR